MKRISTAGYQALRDAIPATTWYLRTFETWLRTSLRDHPELLAGLNFRDMKRVVADQLVDRLIKQESKYQQVTLQLMLEIASMTRFPDLERIKDEPDRTRRLDQAKRAVANLQSVVGQYSDDIAEAQRAEAAIKARADQAAAIRRFNDDLEAVRLNFMEQYKETDTRVRGGNFESILEELFLLYDLQPRIAYHIDLEQIDGSFSFDTDDYILEARWRAESADRGDGDIFAAKVRSKGKNAMGLFVSVNGFTSKFIERFEEGTPFITMEGTDLYAVLEGRIRLDDLLRAKKRHANDTGSCYLPVKQLM